MSPDCFAVGDVVRIRKWKDMESEFGTGFDGHIACTCMFVLRMRESCGKLCTVLEKDGKYVHLAFVDRKINAKMRGYEFSTDMIEPADYSDMRQEAIRSVSDFLAEV